MIGVDDISIAYKEWHGRRQEMWMSYGGGEIGTAFGGLVQMLLRGVDESAISRMIGLPEDGVRRFRDRNISVLAEWRLDGRTPNGPNDMLRLR